MISVGTDPSRSGVCGPSTGTTRPASKPGSTPVSSTRRIVESNPALTESEEKNEFLKQEMEKVRKENELLKENMQAIHALVPQCKEKVQRVQISDSNEGKDQNCDQMLPGQHAVQTPESLDLNSEEEEIDNETRSKIALSTIAVALNNTNCSVPCFVQVMDRYKDIFNGFSVGGGLRTNYEMIVLKVS